MSKVAYRTAIVAVTTALCLSMSACKSDEDRAGEAAMNFLDYELSGKKTLAYELVSKEDQAAKPKSEYIESNALAESMRQALQDKVSNKLRDVNVDKEAGTATAVVEVTAPNIFKAALEDKEPDEMPMMTNERSIGLVKEGDAWKVDTDWAEEKKKEEERQRERQLEAKADALVEKARALIPPDKLHEAKAKLEEALDFKPDHQAARGELEGVEAQLAKLVAGHWRLEREVSEMTDEENAYTYLPSSNFDDAPFDRTERASLYVRCREGDFSVYFAFPNPVDLSLDDYRYGPRVRGTLRRRRCQANPNEPLGQRRLPLRQECGELPRRSPQGRAIAYRSAHVRRRHDVEVRARRRRQGAGAGLQDVREEYVARRTAGAL